MPEYICHKCHNWKSEKCEKNMTGDSFGMVVACGRYEPLTNADHIRSMSDDELCELLMEDAPCDRIVCPHREGPYECRKCILTWLQQPAEGWK